MGMIRSGAIGGNIGILMDLFILGVGHEVSSPTCWRERLCIDNGLRMYAAPSTVLEYPYLPISMAGSPELEYSFGFTG